MKSRGAKFWQGGSIPLIAPEILGNIIAEVADVGVVISDAGIILSVLVNPMHDEFSRLEDWEGKDFRDAMTDDCVSKFDSRLNSFLSNRMGVRPIEINHTHQINRLQYPVRYSFHRIGPTGAILLLGRDLRPIAELQQQLVKAQIAIERDHEAQREFDARFRVLMEATNDQIVFVSVHTGRITDANGPAALLLGRPRQAIIGAPMAGEFEGNRSKGLVEALTELANQVHQKPLKVQLRNVGQAVEIFPRIFRAAGERLLLCRISAPRDGKLTDAKSHFMTNMFENGPDGIVFASQDGMILSANAAFLDLIDGTPELVVKGRSIVEYLQRGSVDLNVMTDNAARAGRMRLYPTKTIGEYGTPRAVEISVTALSAGSTQMFAFVFRDASRIEAARPTDSTLSSENVRSILGMVGTTSLKDIVARSSDVVEKMCIEAAVDLTRNNRVAAAEMLGLSRQSLYVKLRKYDLVSKDGGADD